MIERKFIVSHAFGYDYGGKNKDCGAQDKVQPLLDDGWKIVDMKLSGRTPGDSTVLVYLERETATTNNGQLPIRQGLEY